MMYYITLNLIKTLRIVVPKVERKMVFDEVHSGVLGAHLREAKIHGQLSRHYWWPRMHADINNCLVSTV